MDHPHAMHCVSYHRALEGPAHGMCAQSGGADKDDARDAREGQRRDRAGSREQGERGAERGGRSLPVTRSLFWLRGRKAAFGVTAFSRQQRRHKGSRVREREMIVVSAMREASLCRTAGIGRNNTKSMGRREMNMNVNKRVSKLRSHDTAGVVRAYKNSKVCRLYETHCHDSDGDEVAVRQKYVLLPCHGRKIRKDRSVRGRLCLNANKGHQQREPRVSCYELNSNKNVPHHRRKMVISPSSSSASESNSIPSSSSSSSPPVAHDDSDTTTTTTPSHADSNFLSFSSFWKFLRPHTIRGTILASFSVTIRSLIESPGSINFYLIPRALLGVLALLCGNGFIVGINQIYDTDIDKLNKPFLPIASGEMQVGVAWTVITALAIVGMSISGICFGKLICGLYCFGLILGTIYSVPPLRLKRFAVPSFMIIATVRGFLLNFGVYHAARAAMKLPFR